MDQDSEHRPIMCRLDVFNREEAKRHQALWDRIERQKEGVEDLPHGYTILFSLDDRLFVDLAEFVTLERRCCPFLDFDLVLQPTAGKIGLRLTGGTGVKDFLRQELSSLTGF